TCRSSAHAPRAQYGQRSGSDAQHWRADARAAGAAQPRHPDRSSSTAGIATARPLRAGGLPRAG
ncbi:hypothetical protein, partial [Ralstonia solanacearum]|uniref:hypothetical protein n=1 Tax=Ralstonia solanacearum TaxID=305 RepID=UPI0019D33668